MTIDKIRENLQNTIKGKEDLVLKMYRERGKITGAERIAVDAAIEFIELNVLELKKILKDVEECCEP